MALLLGLAPRTAAALTLDEAIAAAVEHAPTLRAAGARIEASKASIEASLGSFDLQLGADIQLNSSRRTGTDLTGARRAFDTRKGSLDLTLTQPLVWGTRLSLGLVHTLTETDNPFLNCIPGLPADTCVESRVELSVVQPLLRGAGRDAVEGPERRARAERAVAERERGAAAAALILDVVRAYIELCFARSNELIEERHLGFATERHLASQARVEIGTLAAVDLPAVEHAVADRKLALYRARQAVADRAEALGALIGQPEELVRIGALLELELPAVEGWATSLAETTEMALTDHPELKVFDERIRREQTALGPLVNAMKPQLDLTGIASQSGLDEDFGAAVGNLPNNDTNFFGLGLTLLYPWQNRRAEGELTASLAAIGAARFDRQARAQEIEKATGEAWRGVLTAAEVRQLALESARLARRTLEAEQSKLDLGRATNLDVIEVERQVALADLAIARAHADQLLATAQLRFFTGQLLAHHRVQVD